MKTLASMLCLVLALSSPACAQTSLSNLNSGSSVNGTDLFYDVQTPGMGGVKVTGSQIAAFVQGGTGASVLNSGAKCDGLTDDTTAIQAAITAAGNGTNGGVVLFPAGTCLVSGQLTIAKDNVALVGQGSLVSGFTSQSVIKSSSTTADVIHVNAGLVNTQIRRLTIDGSGVQTAGSGVFIDNANSAYIEYVTVQNRYNGFALGSTSFSVCIYCIAQSNFNNGIMLFNSVANIPAQWDFTNTLSQLNNGWGYQFSSASGAANTTMGHWLHPNSFANSSGGIQILGQSGADINDLFLSAITASSDGGDEIQLTPDGGSNIILNSGIIELAGQGGTGRAQATSASHVGHGINIAGSITSKAISISNIISQHNSQEGLLDSNHVVSLNISNFQSLGNSRSVSGGGINISNSFTNVTLVGSASYNDDGTTSQTYGLITVATNTLAIGNLFANNANNNATGGCQHSGFIAIGNTDQDSSCGAILQTPSSGNVLQLSNVANGATNPNKFFSMTSVGRLDLINNAFSGALMRWNDVGDPHSTVTIPGWLTVATDVGPVNNLYVAGSASFNTTGIGATGLNVGGNVNVAGTYSSNSVVGVSCNVGTLSPTTAVVTNGIITHC